MKKRIKLSPFLDNLKKNDYLIEYFDDFHSDLLKKFELFYKKCN